MRDAGSQPHGADPRGEDALRRGLSGAQVLLRAEIGSVQMPIERMLELVPGSLVRLQEQPSDGVRLFAEGVSLGRGRPGRSGTHRAIKLESTTEPAIRAATLCDARAQRARARARGCRADARDRRGSRDAAQHLRTGVGGARQHPPSPRAGRSSWPRAPWWSSTSLRMPRSSCSPTGCASPAATLVVTGDGEWGVQVDALV